MEDLSGKQLGAYRVVAPLGEGGMAAVYRAYQPSVDRYVALKILPRHFAKDPEFVGRFEQEARVIAKFQHPHILPIHDFGEEDGYTYIVMPFIEGGTLSDLLGQPLSPEQMCHIISQVGGALDYAHSQGVIHRDVKPSNVLIDRLGNCLLTDFGIAKVVEDTAHLTETGKIVGTYTYISPEQVQGEILDGRSDIYSLGVVLYEMATGRPPYRAETPPAILFKHVHGPLPLPRTFNPDLLEGIERVILKALTRNREDRYATANDMAEALRAAATCADIIPAEDEDLAQETAATAVLGEAVGEDLLPPRRPMDRRWLLAGVGVAVVLAVIGLAALLGWLAGPSGEGEMAMGATVPLGVSPPAAEGSAPEPTPTPPPTPVPQPTPTPTVFPPDDRYQIISLESIANDNLGAYGEPPSGDVILGEVPFSVSTSFGTQGDFFRDRPISATLKIDPPISNPDKIFILMNSGATYSHFEGLQLGRVDLGFSDGGLHTTQLIAGQNIREWQFTAAGVVGTLSSPDVQEVFQVQKGGEDFAVLDMLTITVPESQRASDLSQITFTDTSQSTTGSFDPGFFVAAVTVEQN